MPLEQRWGIAAGLASHGEDATDHNLPLMAWWVAEPLTALDPQGALAMGLASPLPKQLEYTSRRTAAIGTSAALNTLAATLTQTTDEAKQLAILRGLNAALRPGAKAPLPDGWDALAAKLEEKSSLRLPALVASVKFGSAAAMETMRGLLSDPKADAGSRNTALETLLVAKDSSLAPTLQQLLNDASLRGAAIRALAAYDDAGTPPAILAAYPHLSDHEKRDALTTLGSRAAYAVALAKALEDGAVPVRDLTAELVRQIRQLKQAGVNSTLDKLWGTVRDSPAEKQKEIAHYRDVYRAGGSTPGDARRGRAIFARTCQQCHTLFGEGAKIGPDLTGSNRGNLDYLLENIVTPNAVIPNDYRAAIIETKDGRTLFGVVKQQTAQSVTVATLAETTTLARTDIKSFQISDISMMPEGLLTAFKDQEVRDLLYYLRSPAQAPMPDSH
jgi:putative heme-binding domain-containing protein